jgi:hypothetical protein
MHAGCVHHKALHNTQQTSIRQNIEDNQATYNTMPPRPARVMISPLEEANYKPMWLPPGEAGDEGRELQAGSQR